VAYKKGESRLSRPLCRMLVTSFSSLFSFVFLLLQLLVADPISFLGFNLEVCFSVATFSSVSDLYHVVQWRSGCLLLVSV
jgi:hypothetical protein